MANTALSTQTFEMGYAEGVLPASVKFSGRQFRSSMCELIGLVVFLAAVVGYLAIGLEAVANQNIRFEDAGIVLDDDLQQQLTDCEAQNPFSGRLLQDKKTCQTLFCWFAEAPEIPAITMGLAPIIAGIFVALLYFFSKAMTWFCVIFNIAVYALVGVALMMEGASDAGAILLVFSGIWAALTWCYRAKVWMAARHLKTATLAISKNLSVFVPTALLEGLLLGSIASFWFFILASSKWLEIETETGFCLAQPAQSSTKLQIQAAVLLWILNWLNSAKMVTTAMVVGSWFFEQKDDKPTAPALSALKSSLTTSSPSISVGSLITAFVEWCIRQATDTFWFTDPVKIALHLLYCCLASCIIALTRFALIAHAFTGDSFFSSSKSVYEVMKRNFAGAYVVSRVGCAVMNTMSSIGSIGLGLAAWAWLDEEIGVSTLSDIMSVFDSLFLVVVFFLAYFWLIKRPMFTLLAITLLMQTIERLMKQCDTSVCEINQSFFPPVGSIFVGSVSMIIISFVGDVVMDALDTIFLAYAVASDNKLSKPTEGGRAAVYVMMEDGDIPEAQIVKS